VELEGTIDLVVVVVVEQVVDKKRIAFPLASLEYLVEMDKQRISLVGMEILACMVEELGTFEELDRIEEQLVLEELVVELELVAFEFEQF